MAGAGEGFASPALIVQTLSAVKLSLKDGEPAFGCGGPQIMSLLRNDPGFVGTKQISLRLWCQNPGQCSCLGNEGAWGMLVSRGSMVKALAFFFFLQTLMSL